VGGDGVDDLNGVRGGADDVAFGFDLDGGVDIADDDVVRVLAFEGAEHFDRAAVDEGAAGIAVRDDDGAGGIEGLGGFGHEPDAAEGDDFAVEFPGFAGEFEAVADDVGEFLDLGFLVVVGEDDRVALALQREDLVGDAGTDWSHRN
jgi:hypothetical protein